MDSVKSSNEAFVGRMPALVASMILLAIHQAMIGARTNLPFRRVNIGNDRWSWSVEGRKFSVVKDGNAESASVINDQIRALRVDAERYARLLDDAPPSNMSPAAQEERAARRAEWTREKRSLEYRIEQLQKQSETVVQRFEIDLAQVASRKPLFFFAEESPIESELLLEYWPYGSSVDEAQGEDDVDFIVVPQGGEAVEVTEDVEVGVKTPAEEEAEEAGEDGKEPEETTEAEKPAEVDAEKPELAEVTEVAEAEKPAEETSVAETVAQETSEPAEAVNVPVEAEKPAEEVEEVRVEVESPGDLDATPRFGFPVDVQVEASEAPKGGDEDEPVKIPYPGFSLSQLADQEEAAEATKATPKGNGAAKTTPKGKAN
jgi:hypothetical protein